MNTNRLFCIVFIFFCLALTIVDARHHHLENDIEYRDMDDYQEYGVFIDAVPLKTTPHPKNIKNHHKSNRLSKLKKYFDDSSDFYH
ncbi:hypothetical protein FO519_000500 [Halicephalobus sp. NKZ332]|nr:hypothetical protein FO519_000500 [Halicephalobus sp. NKZ332]